MGSLPRTSAHQSTCSLSSSPYWWQSPWLSPTTPTPWAPMWVTIPVSTLASTISTVFTTSMVFTTQECSLQCMGSALLRLNPRWSPTPTMMLTTSTKEHILLLTPSALWSTIMTVTVCMTVMMLPPTSILLSMLCTQLMLFMELFLASTASTTMLLVWVEWSWVGATTMWANKFPANQHIGLKEQTTGHMIQDTPIDTIVNFQDF